MGIYQGVGDQAFSLGIWELEAGGSQWVQVQPGLQSEFQDNQICYTDKTPELLYRENLSWKTKSKQKDWNGCLQFKYIKTFIVLYYLFYPTHSN